MSAPSAHLDLKASLKRRLRAGERLSPLHPRAYPVEGWWRGGVSLTQARVEGWPLPVGAAVIEASDGYRFGPENLTLAWALEGREARCVLDLGAGSGSLGLIALLSARAAQLIAVERQAQQVERLSRTLEAFCAVGVTQGVHQVLHADLRAAQLAEELKPLTPQGRGADLIVMNPPFFPEGWGRESGSPEVHASTHALFGDARDFLKLAAQLLSPEGEVCVLYDASRLADLLPALSEVGLGVRAIKYTPDARADRRAQPFRVWLFAGRGGAPVTSLLKPATLEPPPSSRGHL